MKIEALEHPKTLELADQLGIELPTAIGHLELLWAFVAKTTPNGAVGKYSNAVIADKARWRGKPSDFVQALVTVGFLDEDSGHRLLVHDWEEHCPNWVRSKMTRAGIEFAVKTPLASASVCGNEASSVATSDTSNDSTSEATSRAQILPSLAKPSPAKPSEGKTPSPANVPREASLSASFPDFAMATYPPCTGRRSWSTALHHASVIVATGKAGEEDLRRRLSGYRAYFDAGATTPEFVYTPQNFFDHLAEDPPCLREWSAPLTKAQIKQDANVAASQEWLARSAS